MRTFSKLLSAALASAAFFFCSNAPAEKTAVESAIRAPFLREIDLAVFAGDLSFEEAISVRELAVTAPDTLGEPWRTALAENPIPGWAATAILLENRQWTAAREGIFRGATIQYPFPAELEFHLDSQIFPLRVYYANGEEAALAQGILEAAELSWQREIVEWGFVAPPLVTPEGRYRLYVGEAGEGVGGYMNPFAWYDEAEWDACVSYVLIDVAHSADDVGPVVAHEMNHAMQAAMDCLEQLAFFENTATFVMAPVYPDSGLAYQNGVLSSFQSQSSRSVCRGESGETYMYGGFLWPHFLAYTYEDEANGPSLVRRIWEGAMQSSGQNTVDYMASLDALLRDEYETDVNAAFESFSIARFLLDELAFAPLATMRNAALYRATPPVSGTISVATDGVYERTPSSGLEAYAAHYYALEAPSGFDREVSVSFKTEAEGPWVLLQFSADGSEMRRVEAISKSAAWSYLATPDEREFLAVVRTADTASFDPAQIPEAAGYTLTIGPTTPAPRIDSVSPGSLARSESAMVEVFGAHFQEGAEVEISPAGVTVLSAQTVDDGTIEVTVQVAADAALRNYSLTAINPDGAEATLYSILEVEERSVTPTTSGDENGAGDSGCRAMPGVGRDYGASLPELLAAIL